MCDLAEYYHVLNFLEHKPLLIATLVLGLREDSRLRMKYNGQKLNLNVSLNAIAVDCLKLLVWSKTEDATKGINPPISIYNELCGVQETKVGFDTPEEYEKARLKILEELKNG